MVDQKLLAILQHSRRVRFRAIQQQSGFATPKTPVCEAPLGMQDNKIPDSALSASSTLNSYHTPPANGRLHFQAASKYGGWSGKRQDESPYFQVNFGNWTNVTKVATQGGHDGVWWTKSYSLAYSYDGVFFQDYKEDDIVKVFPGNSDQYTVVAHTLKIPITTRYLRIKPKSWKNTITLRAEFYGCREGITPPEIVCASALGLESGQIPDSAMTASSVYNRYSEAERARLNKRVEGSHYGAWVPKTTAIGEWIQVDLGEKVKVTRIATQGRYSGNWWITSYSLSYRTQGGSTFESYKNDKEFQGNSDDNTAVGNIIDPPIIARYIKIHPKTWHSRVALRLELYGCKEAFYMNSTILSKNKSYSYILRKFLDPVAGNNSRWLLCYRASTNGWEASTFHINCNGKKNTVTIIESGNHVFGGFTDIPWDSSDGYGSTSKAFIFSLRNNEGLGAFRSTVADPSKAIYRSSESGPKFGEGDIFIADNANSNNQSFASFGESYSVPSRVQDRLTILAGSLNFSPDDWEVLYLA